ncbi:PD-(D/E)XK nuclease family protein [Natronospora cellulosivora (SeqCode)]
MLISNIEELYFSQSAFAVYQKCPLRFRYRYLDGLFWPQDWGGSEDQKELIEMGSKFHRLAQRYYARGEEIAEEILSGQLRLWFDKLKEFKPFNSFDDFYPEQEMRINKGGMKLLVKFDLLFSSKNEDKLIIYDWKTNKQPLSAQNLQDNIQTRLYLYVLYQAGEKYYQYQTENRPPFGIVYWNPRFPDDKVTITYNNKKFQQDERYFLDLVQEIKGLDYHQFTATEDPAICKYCEYRPICHGKKAEFIAVEEDDLDLNLDWDTIDEIDF